jgi:hypothetical protein
MQEGENWLDKSLWGLKGTLRYLKGKQPSEKLESWRVLCFVLSQRHIIAPEGSEQKIYSPNRTKEYHQQRQGYKYLGRHILDENGSPSIG